MKIAITADVHLREDRLERLNTLCKLFQSLISEGISHLIIAGDLFDKEVTNYGFFEDLVKNFPAINLYIIPGNHDYGLSQKHLSCPNIMVFTTPEFHSIGPAGILFLPFMGDKLMDEVLTEFWEQKDRPSQWVLIGHGDYIGSYHQPNPYEEGIYMPLSAKAIERYQPQKVLLGHIHKPYWHGIGRVYYPGSPCGLHINETGLRGFLIMDLETFEVSHKVLESEIIYFVETVWVYPVDEEIELLQNSLQDMIRSWKLDEKDLSRVILRLHLHGYTRDKQRVIETVKKFLSHKGIKLYDNSEPIISQLNSLLEYPYYDESQALFKKVKSTIDTNEIEDIKKGYLIKEEILEKVLDILYGH